MLLYLYNSEFISVNFSTPIYFLNLLISVWDNGVAGAYPIYLALPKSHQRDDLDSPLKLVFRLWEENQQKTQRKQCKKHYVKVFFYFSLF